MSDRQPLPHRHRRTTGLKIAFGVAAAAFALAVPLEVGRLVMLGLFSVTWLSLIVSHRILEARGRSSGLRPYIVLLGLGLVLLILILLGERQKGAILVPNHRASHAQAPAPPR